tara:strand:+ start:213 stop:335 length:123 start_codon:yes stop_codon:yes gene_type:complete
MLEKFEKQEVARVQQRSSGRNHNGSFDRKHDGDRDHGGNT